MKLILAVASALLSAVCGIAAPGQQPQDTNSMAYHIALKAKACQVDNTVPPSKAFVKPFSGTWRAASQKHVEEGTWGEIASIWPRPNGAGTFVLLEMLDDPSAGDWGQSIAYCFGPDRKVAWIESRYVSFDQDSRVEHYDYSPLGVPLKHKVWCVNLDSGKVHPVDQKCKFAKVFPLVKGIDDFSFLRHKS